MGVKPFVFYSLPPRSKVHSDKSAFPPLCFTFSRCFTDNNKGSLVCVLSPQSLVVSAGPLEQPSRAVSPPRAGSSRTGSLSTGRISCAPSDKTPRRGSYSGRISEYGSVCAALQSRGLNCWVCRRLWFPRRPPRCRWTPPDHRSPSPGPPHRSQTPSWKDPSFSGRV